MSNYTPRDPERRIYASAIDTWLLVVIGLCMAGTTLLTAWSALTGAQPVAIAITAATTIAMGALFADVLINTSYTVANGKLIIKCGITQCHTVEISEITLIRKTQSLLSAPALSVRHRIEVKYGHRKSIIISPRNRHDFIDNLLHINPLIEIRL